ncbi:MAG TPA: DnaB-like helicase C-terminal domain-containing protein, partial [Planctomycetota bacterium]|nr:DnaB-like helicase C-terminal domain-containing protein [Planctomycetota bacterium]
FANDVREASIRRRLQGIASEMIAAAAVSPATSSDLIERFAKNISHLAERRGEDPVRRMADVLQEVVDAIEREQGTPGGLVGLDTGFATLNALTNGWQRGSLIVVGARPSVGKTTFALTTALHVAKGDKGVYLASAEMSAPEIVRNALCNLGRVSSSLIRSGRMTAIHWRRLVSDGAAAAFNLRFFLDDSPNPTVRQIRNRVRRLAAMPSGLDLVVVDYLQLLRATEGTNREQEVASLARELKVLAREFNVPVIALSQLNRASTARSDHRPTPADLRESGAIEQHADMIILLHPKDAPASGLAPANVTIQVDLAKNRNGQTGTVDLVRVGPEFRFEDGAAA